MSSPNTAMPYLTPYGKGVVRKLEISGGRAVEILWYILLIVHFMHTYVIIDAV